MLHNFYRQRGGEERAVSEQLSLLTDRGHYARLLERHSESISRKGAGTQLLLGGSRPEDVAEIVKQDSIDVVHVHNMLPSFGVKALIAARAAGAAVVLNLHNYRLFCGTGIGYRNGDLCTRCKGLNTSAGAVLRCRGSFTESAAYSVSLSLHQRKLMQTVNRFALPSKGMLIQLEKHGFKSQAVDQVRNFLPPNQFADRSTAGTGDFVLYVGRITEEKGVQTAVEACAKANVPLKVVGEGPDYQRVQQLTSKLTAEVTFTGQLTPSEVAEVRSRAAISLMPSKWSEPAPYSVVESMAAGVPVLVSSLGGLPELTDNQNTVLDNTADGWSKAIKSLWSDREKLQRAGEQALSYAKQNFNQDRAYEDLIASYTAALNSRKAT